MCLTRISLFALVSAIVVLLAGVAQGFQEKAMSGAETSLSDIAISFMLDERITRGMYMGERWVSPPTYTGVSGGETFTLDARARGLDVKGRPRDISPEWTPEDPDMVTVSPNQGHQVKITVHRAGQSTLTVTYGGLSKKLTVKASLKDKALYVDISQ